MADRSSAQHNEQETRAAELEANYPISLGLASSLDLPTIVNAVRELAFTLIPNLRDAAIFLYHEGQLTSTASRSFDAATSNRLADPQPGDSIYAAAQQGEIVTIPNIEADPRFADSPTPRQGTLVSVPLKAGASVVGVMTLILDQPYTFRELELRQLQVLGAQAAIAIQNAGLYEQAQQELVRHLKAEATLRQLNAELEQRIQQRTAELEAANRSLRNGVAAGHQAEARSRDILAAIPDLIFEISPDCVFVDCHAAVPEELLMPPEAFLGKHIREVLSPDLVEELTMAMGMAASTGEAQIVEYHMETRAGLQDFEARVTPTSSGNLLFIIRNITGRKRAETALRESEERFMLAVRGANDGLWDWDLRTDRIYFSPRWKAILGYEENDIGEEPDEWFSRVHPDDIERINIDITSHIGGITPFFANEHRLRHKDGAYRWVLARGLAVRDAGRKAHRMAGSLTDITDRKAAEEQLVHNALHDALTGLPNRVYFIDQVKRSIERARRRGELFAAVMFIDLDGFKSVNDSLGHDGGDKLLVTIAHRLEACLRPGDTVARFGGDEFAVLLESVHQINDAIRIAERIQNQLSKPVELVERNMVTTASIGIALMDKEYERPEDILRDADAAMYQAKATGKARHAVFERGPLGGPSDITRR